MLVNRTVVAVTTFAESVPDRHRYGLTNICVDREKTVATNGHYLVAVSHSNQSDDAWPAEPAVDHMTFTNGERVLITRDAAIAAAKGLPKQKKNYLPILQHAALAKDGSLHTTDLENSQIFTGKPEGGFPNWQAVVPTEKPVAVIGFDARYVAEIAKFVAKYGNEQLPTIKLTIYGADRAARFDATSEDGQEIMALLMPIRLGKVK